jgi:ankyrin repeat protein
MPLVKVSDDFLCSVTREVFTDPVVTSLGNTYERSAIEKHFARGAITCPLTNEPLPDRKLTPNKHLKSQVESFRQSVLSANKFKAAIESGDLKTLETSPFWPMEDYKTVDPLFLAVKSNQLSVLCYLLKEFQVDPVKIQDVDGNSLLHRAGTSSPEMIRYLVWECKLGLEAKNCHGHTPLLQTLSDCVLTSISTDCLFMRIIRELLVAGASPTCNTDTRNVLYPHRFFLDLGKLLVQYGAGVPAVVEQIFADGRSVLYRHWNASLSASRQFEYLLSLIPDEARRVTMVRRIVDSKTLLHMSIRNPDILKLLLAPPYSLSPTSVNEAGFTYLHHWAQADDDLDGSEETLAILLAAGIDIHAKNKAGMTALHCAARSDAVRFHQLMLAGADSSIRDSSGKCAFDSLSDGNLRVIYTRSIQESKKRASESESYIGKKIEVLYPSGSWLPSKIVQVRASR